MKSRFGEARDIYFMQKALVQAHKAALKDEVPVGAVVVNPDGEIIASGYNNVERSATQRAHAEMQALAKAGKKFGDWRLVGHWVYVTLEPCSMCMHMILLSRLEGVVFGAPSPLFGNHLDKNGSLSLYKKDVITVIANVCSAESAQILRTFFQNKRNKRG